MSLLRRTTPVALMVGATLGVVIASFQSVDAIFANPGIVISFGNLLAFLARAYFLYIVAGLIVTFTVNLLLCLIMKRKMAEADYPRLLEYYVGISIFCILLLFYMWKDQLTISEIMNHRRGAFPRIFFLLEMVVLIGIASFIIAGAIHQLARRLGPGRLALYISSLCWFLLLFPLIGEGIIWGFLLQLPYIVHIIVLLILAFLVSFLIRYLNRLTHGLIALKRKSWIGLGIFAVVILIACGVIGLLQPKPTYAPRSGSEMNVLLLSVDALRPDHLGCYGYEPVPKIEAGEYTPNIDKLASEGLLFEKAYSTSTWTLASIASWMTGAWPVESGGTRLNRRIYNALPTLPEKLREEGYNSAAFITNPFLNPRTKIGRGFSKYWEFFDHFSLSSGLFIDELNFYLRSRLDARGMRESNRMIVKKQLDEAYGWLDEHQKEKFFMWIHLYDPHFPYSPPSPYRQEVPDFGGEKRIPVYFGLSKYRSGSDHHRYGLKRHIVNLYDAEIRYSDEVVGDILAKLDALGLSGDTLVIFTSDHGEEFFDHNGFEHGHASYEEVIHVPLIFRLPGKIPAGERIAERISLIDLFPTILDFAGADNEIKIHRGESLKDAVINADMSKAGSGQMRFTPRQGEDAPGVADDMDKKLREMYFPKSDYLPDGRLAGIWLDEEPGTRNPPESPLDAIGKAADIFGDVVGSRLRGGSEPMPEGRVIFTEELFYFDFEEKAIIIGDWKLIHSRNRLHDSHLLIGRDSSKPSDSGLPNFIEGDELYNLADDPFEIKNVIYEHPEIAKYLYERLMEIDYLDRREAVSRQLVEGENPGFGAGLRNALKSLGYIGS